MKCLAAASLVLLHQVAAQSPCPSDLTQISTISSTETMYYEVVDGVLCARLESESEGWLGFGISPTGMMVPSEAVIGLPDEGTVLKYDLTGKSTSAGKFYTLQLCEQILLYHQFVILPVRVFHGSGTHVR